MELNLPLARAVRASALGSRAGRGFMVRSCILGTLHLARQTAR
jgi:hypothetical protein